MDARTAPMAELYGFSGQSAQRIAAAVKRIESMAGDSQQPAYEPETTGAESFVDRHVGTFTGLWAKGTTADVTVTADSGSTYTETATNYFADVGESNGTTDCVILLAGSEWVLVSASPSPVTECIELSKVEPSGNLTLLSAINPTGSVVTGVACLNGNLTVTTASLSDLIVYTETTVTLSDLANVTTQNLTLPKQEGCG